MNTKNIKDFLIDTEILSEEQIKRIQDKIFMENRDEEADFLETALELNFIEPTIAQEILSLILSIPSIDLKKKPVDLETLSILPEPISREKKAIVFEKKGNKISIAISNFESLEELQEILPTFEIDYYLSDIQNINKKIIQYQKLLRENWESSLFSSLDSIPKIKDFAFRKYDEIQPKHLQDITDSHYSEKFLISLFEYALKSQAEFIYFDDEEDHYGIYFRIFSERYKIMEISSETAVSLILKLKKYVDLPTAPGGVTEKTIQEGNFKAALNNEVHDIFVSFIKTNTGVSVNIQLDKKILFPLPFPQITPQQQEIYFQASKKSSGLILLSSENDNLEFTYSFVSLAEMESKKNKKIYSITNQPVEYKISTVNHISLQKGEKKTLLVSKIIKTRPDVLFIDSITKPLIPILMNYVGSGKKVYLKLEQDFYIFLENILKFNFEKYQIIKNLSYSITHQSFKKLNADDRKKYKLKTTEKKLIKTYLPQIDFKKYTFYTKNKNKFLEKKKNEKIIRGIFEVSPLLEKAFIERIQLSKLKKEFKIISRKSVLENALLKHNLEEIDIKEILKFLK